MVNNFVYRAGIATCQSACEEVAGSRFETRDWLDERLVGNR